MFGPQFCLNMIPIEVSAKELELGRALTQREITDIYQETFNRIVSAGTMHTMAQIQAAKIERPARGFFGRLFCG